MKTGGGGHLILNTEVVYVHMQTQPSLAHRSATQVSCLCGVTQGFLDRIHITIHASCSSIAVYTVILDHINLLYILAPSPQSRPNTCRTSGH
jgi:hypothetical protein